MKGVIYMTIDKKFFEGVKTNMKKYMPEILDVAIYQAHMKECIDHVRSYFDTMPETQRERIKRLLKDGDQD